MAEPTDEEIRAARRVRPGTGHLLRGTQRHGRGGQQGGDDVPSLMEIERRILEADDALADLVEDFSRIADEEAHARADWEGHRDRFLVILANGGGKASTVTEGVALAKQAPDDHGILGEDLYRTWLLLKSARDACSKNLDAVQSRLSALQTLARGLRTATGLTP